MRRMIPQKLIDFINKVKAKLGFNASGDLEVADDLHVGGDLEVSGAINGQENPSVKPIYFHPIVVVGGSSETDLYSLYIVILDNNNEEYDNTTKLKNKMLEIATSIEATARIGCSGSYYNRGTAATFIPSHIDARYSDNKLYLYGMYLGGNRTYIDITDLVFASVYDGVNKIN